MNTKELTRDIIGILIVLGALFSLFFTVQEGASEVIRFLAGTVIGYYYGASVVPLAGLMNKRIN
jgi:hypothetical protein